MKHCLSCLILLEQYCFHSQCFTYSFPVYGWKWQEFYSAYYRYIPLVESPGLAFITIDKKGLSPSQRLINEVFATWPYLLITTLLAALAGIVIWFLVRKLSMLFVLPLILKFTFLLKNNIRTRFWGQYITNASFACFSMT